MSVASDILQKLLAKERDGEIVFGRVDVKVIGQPVTKDTFNPNAKVTTILTLEYSTKDGLTCL